MSKSMMFSIKRIIFWLCLLCVVVVILFLVHREPVSERKVVVEARGQRASVSAWQRRGDKWTEVFRTDDGYVGRNGVTENKVEGDQAVPIGEFELRRAFGVVDNPDTNLAYTRIKVDDVWVDDPDSKYYNQYIHSGSGIKRDWKTAEELSRLDMAYKYAIVVEYNTNPVIPGKGSAIFFNLSNDHATGGDIAVPEKYLKRFLKFVQPGDKIVIKRAE